MFHSPNLPVLISLAPFSRIFTLFFRLMILSPTTPYFQAYLHIFVSFLLYPLLLSMFNVILFHFRAWMYSLFIFPFPHKFEFPELTFSFSPCFFLHFFLSFLNRKRKQFYPLLYRNRFELFSYPFYSYLETAFYAFFSIINLYHVKVHVPKKLKLKSHF